MAEAAQPDLAHAQRRRDRDALIQRLLEERRLERERAASGAPPATDAATDLATPAARCARQEPGRGTATGVPPVSPPGQHLDAAPYRPSGQSQRLETRGGAAGPLAATARSRPQTDAAAEERLASTQRSRPNPTRVLSETNPPQPAAQQPRRQSAANSSVQPHLPPPKLQPHAQRAARPKSAGAMPGPSASGSEVFRESPPHKVCIVYQL